MTDKQKALIDLAKSFIGVHESGGNNRGHQVEIFQSIISKPMGQPWCLDFVQYCVHEIDKAFLSKTVLYPTENTQIAWLKTPKVARLENPVPGCIVIWTDYHGDTPTSLGHCGVVAEVLGAHTFKSIEGNTSSEDHKVERNGDGVYEKTRELIRYSGSMRVAGFILPWV